MILVIGSAIAKEGYLSEALALSQEHVARSRTEQGCISHAVYEDTEDAQRLIFLEQWVTQAALAEHFNVPASREFAKALAALCSAEPTITVFDATPVQSPAKRIG